jgi:hypothetical protein
MKIMNIPLILLLVLAPMAHASAANMKVGEIESQFSGNGTIHEGEILADFNDETIAY